LSKLSLKLGHFGRQFRNQRIASFERFAKRLVFCFQLRDLSSNAAHSLHRSSTSPFVDLFAPLFPNPPK
jgi:hypothetical protein